jgi:hypothetical protein
MKSQRKPSFPRLVRLFPFGNNSPLFIMVLEKPRGIMNPVILTLEEVEEKWYEWEIFGSIAGHTPDVESSEVMQYLLPPLPPISKPNSHQQDELMPDAPVQEVEEAKETSPSVRITLQAASGFHLEVLVAHGLESACWQRCYCSGNIKSARYHNSL